MPTDDLPDAPWATDNKTPTAQGDLPDAPWTKDQQPSAPQPSTWWDVGKAAVTGPLRGFGQFITAQREPEFGTMGAIDVPPENIPTQADVERVLPKAQTFPGRVVQNVGEVAGNPLSWIGPGGFATKAAANIASGALGQVGQEVGGPIGGLAGGMLGSIGAESSLSRIAARAGQPRAPTAADIRAAGSAGYDVARSMDVPLSRAAVSNFGASIRNELTSPQWGFRPFNEPKTFAALRLLEEPNDMSSQQLRRRMGTTGAASSNEIMGIRETLSNIQKSNPGTSEARAAGRAIERIDDYTRNIPGLNQTFSRARGDWRAAKGAEELNTAIDRAVRAAQARRGNPADNMRAELNSLINNKRIPRTPEQEAEMRRIVESGGIMQELARFRHSYSPIAALGAVGSLGLGHVSPALELAGSAVVPWATRAYDTRRTRRSIEALRDQILRNAPSGGGPAPPLPPRFSPAQLPPAVIRSLIGSSNPNLNDLANDQRTQSP